MSRIRATVPSSTAVLVDQSRNLSDTLKFNVFVDHDVAGIREAVREWLLHVFPAGTLYHPTEELVPDLSGLPAGVIGVSFDIHSRFGRNAVGGVDLSQSHIGIAIQRVYGHNDTTTRTEIAEQLNQGAGDLEVNMKIEVLPSQRLMGSWSDIIFEPTIHHYILYSLQRAIKLISQSHQRSSIEHLNRDRVFNGLALLWGPPGSGKSSLCRALAQSLSVQFKAIFPRAVLIEIDSHCMHSRYFGESARLVSESFARIGSLLDCSEPPLVFVLIDEVESLALSREDSTGTSGEPKDAMRALNALLTAVDRLRDYRSLWVFCTSNIVSAMDHAFLDRFDFKWHIPGPTLPARYELLRQKYRQLHESHVIVEDGPSFHDGSFVDLALRGTAMHGRILPPHGALVLRADDENFALARRLERISQKAAGLSARVMCKLPWTSLISHTVEERVTLLQAMDALETAVEQEATSVFALGKVGSVVTNAAEGLAPR